MRVPVLRVLGPLIVSIAITLSGLPGVAAPVRAAGTVTALVLDSEPGDVIGLGQQLVYSPPTATITIVTNGPGGATLQVLGPQAGDYWNASLAAVGAAPLAVGTYESAQTSADATHPGLSVSGSVGGRARGCTSSGRFTVSELERDGSGNVTTLAASFEQHCEGGPAALFGEVRYQASSGYKFLVVAPDSVDLGPAVIGSTTPTQTIQVRPSGTIGTAISGYSIVGTNAADFAIVSAPCGPGVVVPAATCDVTVKATPSAAGARIATLVIDNDTLRGQRRVALTVTGVRPVSAVAWGTTRSGPNYSFNLGQSLARSVSGTTTYLHATYTTDRVSGTWVDDNGPYAGIYHVRTSNRGSTFTTPKRLNPSTQHGSRGSLAASGRYLYATWISTSRWIAYKGSAPRVLYLRRNSNYGARTYWNTTKRLTSLTGRVDYPTVAAAGSNVYVAYSDSGTRSIKIKISRDRAATWKTVTLGSSTAGAASVGTYGMPRIAASGNTVVVSWLADNNGAVRARVSTDAGRTWSATGGLTGTSTDIPAVAALGSRAAVAWTDGASAVVSTWSAGAWSAPKATGTPTGVAYTHTYGPALALNGTAGIGVAWTGCVTACESWTSSTRADLVWSESRDAGATWFGGQVIGSSAPSAVRRYHDYASILWASATVRHVLWNAGTAQTNNYRIVLRTGTGVVAATAAVTVSATPRSVDAIDRAISATRLRTSDGP